MRVSLVGRLVNRGLRERGRGRRRGRGRERPDPTPVTTRKLFCLEVLQGPGSISRCMGLTECSIPRKRLRKKLISMVSRTRSTWPLVQGVEPKSGTVQRPPSIQLCFSWLFHIARTYPPHDSMEFMLGGLGEWRVSLLLHAFIPSSSLFRSCFHCRSSHLATPRHRTVANGGG